MKLFAAFEASIALSSAMCPMLTNSSRVLRESRTIQIIEPICSTAGSPISITNETMPGFLTTSVSRLLGNARRDLGEPGVGGQHGLQVVRQISALQVEQSGRGAHLRRLGERVQGALHSLLGMLGQLGLDGLIAGDGRTGELPGEGEVLTGLLDGALRRAGGLLDQVLSVLGALGSQIGCSVRAGLRSLGSLDGAGIGFRAGHCSHYV